MISYPAKILIAWGEAISGNRQIKDWLIANGYKELGLFVHALNNQQEARDWLMKNKFPHLMAVIRGAEGEEKAVKWLEEYKLFPLAKVALAGDGNEDALKWLIINNHRELAVIAQKIKIVKDEIDRRNNDVHSISPD